MTRIKNYKTYRFKNYSTLFEVNQKHRDLNDDFYIPVNEVTDYSGKEVSGYRLNNKIWVSTGEGERRGIPIYFFENNATEDYKKPTIITV